jgi:hypothetical protein
MSRLGYEAALVSSYSAASLVECQQGDRLVGFPLLPGEIWTETHFKTQHGTPLIVNLL